MDPRRVADGSGHTATRAVLMEETLIRNTLTINGACWEFLKSRHPPRRAVLMEETLIRNTLTINGACWEFLKSGIFVATIQPETPQAP